MIRAYAAEQVRQAEEPLLEAGVPLMRDAARALAVTAVREIRARGQLVAGSVVLALVGGGNNGGDALYAVAELSRRGVACHAALLSESVHAEGLAAARSAGVAVAPLRQGDQLDVEACLALARKAGVWLDGIAGIGLAGALREPVAGLVQALTAERETSPDPAVVVAVDVPSGVGDDGALRGPVLPADVTVTMGVAKPGLLLPPADRLAGRVHVVELGLPVAELPVAAARLGAEDVADLYPWPRREDHKYTRGVVGVWAGGDIYPGAAALACRGALAVGPGMVRYRGTAQGVRDALPGVVGVDGRIQAALVGSGMEDGPEARRAVDEALSHGVPLVVDAGAIAALEDLLEHRAEPAPCVVTPHAGELARLLGVGRKDVEARPALRACEYAERAGVVVLLKGATSLVARPSGAVYTQASGTPWLATAGSGDVLAGILAGLLALAQARAEEEGDVLGEQGAAELAAAAAWLHGRAGSEASAGGPVHAEAVADAATRVLAELGR